MKLEFLWCRLKQTTIDINIILLHRGCTSKFATDCDRCQQSLLPVEAQVQFITRTIWVHSSYDKRLVVYLRLWSVLTYFCNYSADNWEFTVVIEVLLRKDKKFFICLFFFLIQGNGHVVKTFFCESFKLSTLLQTLLGPAQHNGLGDGVESLHSSCISVVNPSFPNLEKQIWQNYPSLQLQFTIYKREIT